jgi:hypothetical protein
MQIINNEITVFSKIISFCIKIVKLTSINILIQKIDFYILLLNMREV